MRKLTDEEVRSRVCAPCAAEDHGECEGEGGTVVSAGPTVHQVCCCYGQVAYDEDGDRVDWETV